MTHPHLDAARDLGRLISDNAERTGDRPLARQTVDALVEARLPGVMCPREVGGAELPVLDAIDVFAEVSRADGSAGWCLMASAATTAYFGSYAGDGFVAEMFAGGVPLAAGQFAPNGTAIPDGDGYVISGDYQFGSGILHARWAGAGVVTVPAEGSAEPPEYLFAAFPVEKAELRGNWNVMGLQSTASVDYRVRNVRVTKDATFPFFSAKRRRGGPLYDLGVLCLTAAGHAAFAIGVTRRALDELMAIARTKQRMGAATALRDSELFLHGLGTLESRFRSSLAWVRETFGRAERTVVERGVADPAEVNATRQATVHVTREGADIVREAYLLAGTSALRAGPLERCFRDIHAGSQHFFASPSATLDMARDLMNAAPASPLDA